MVKVSVCTVTYNHGNYLAQAIESVLMQQRDFEIEMIISEDCSTDNTREILRDYAARFPDIIKPIYQDTNVGASQNSYGALQACSGQYIAALEGDDFWTDKNKLARQVGFLDENKEFAICSHNLMVVNAAGNPCNELVRPERSEIVYTLEDLAICNTLATASCLYRNNFTVGPSPTNYPDWLMNVRIGDYCLHMLAARHGKIKYFPDVMGAYRTHSGGAWTKESHVGRAIMFFNTFHHLRKEFSGEVRDKILKQQEASFQILSDADDATLNAFLQQNKEEVLDFLAEDYPRMLELYFHNFNAVRSAEYRLGKTLVKPIRKLADWYRSSS